MIYVFKDGTPYYGVHKDGGYIGMLFVLIATAVAIRVHAEYSYSCVVPVSPLKIADGQAVYDHHNPELHTAIVGGQRSPIFEVSAEYYVLVEDSEGNLTGMLLREFKAFQATVPDGTAVRAAQGKFWMVQDKDVDGDGEKDYVIERDINGDGANDQAWLVDKKNQKDILFMPLKRLNLK